MPDPNLERFGTYDVWVILGQFAKGGPREKVLFEGYPVWTNSKRYILFNEKGTVCVSCGLEACYFALERNVHNEGPSCHFNLYGLTQSGKEILFTRDHIYPKSKGGPNTLDNLQIMCEVCNSRKGDSIA